MNTFQFTETRLKISLEMLFQYLSFACRTWNVQNDWKNCVCVFVCAIKRKKEKFNNHYENILPIIAAWTENGLLLFFVVTKSKTIFAGQFIFFSVDFVWPLKTTKWKCLRLFVVGTHIKWYQNFDCPLICNDIFMLFGFVLDWRFYETKQIALRCNTHARTHSLKRC